MKHTLTVEDSDLLNVGRGVNPGETREDAGFSEEGDDVEVLPLPDGSHLVITGVANGVVTGMVLPAPEFTEESPLDETPVAPVDDLS